MTASADRPRVVVGVNGSADSERALRWAERLATDRAMSLELLTACEYPSYVDAAVAAEWAAYEAIARGAATRFQNMVSPRVDWSTSKVVTGTVGPVLCDAADGADLLVVGRRARPHRPGVRIGSVAAYCAHHARCPVVVVP